MGIAAFIQEPLQGRTSLSKVFWLYGVVGSLLYGALELFLNPDNTLLMRLYVIGGLIFSIYVTLATYRCAANCGSPSLARLTRVAAVISLLLLPVLTYLELTGALSLSSLGVE
jgi:hypothetical protein